MVRTLKVAHAFLMGLLAYFVRYFAILGAAPYVLVLAVAGLAGGLAMIFVIPVSIAMIIWGNHHHAMTGWHGLAVGLEWMVFSFLAGFGVYLLKYLWTRLGQGLDHVSNVTAPRAAKPRKPVLMIEYKPSSPFGVNQH
ncbi:MAG: hypothetical protein M0006_15725 [Magnetospirillum sp.]|nr:hypothetical protein [Magnetospirillum sp.]